MKNGENQLRYFKLQLGFGIAALSSILLLAPKLAVAQPAACSESSVRCWHLIFGVGDAPTRRLYFADFLVRKPEPAITQIDVIDVPEKDGDGADHYVYTMDFKCDQNQMRRNKAYRTFANGKIETQPMSDWVPVPPSFFQRAYELACDPKVRANPSSHSMVMIGNMFRPIDVADLTQQLIWQNSAKKP
jgi:hypothetical protein